MLVGFLKEESGATIIEHGLIALGLSLAIVAASGIIGTTMDLLYGSGSAGIGFGQVQRYGSDSGTGI